MAADAVESHLQHAAHSNFSLEIYGILEMYGNCGDRGLAERSGAELRHVVYHKWYCKYGKSWHNIAICQVDLYHGRALQTASLTGANL